MAIDPLKLLKLSGEGQIIFHHRQKFQYFIIYMTAQAYYKAKVLAMYELKQMLRTKIVQT